MTSTIAAMPLTPSPAHLFPHSQVTFNIYVISETARRVDQRSDAARGLLGFDVEAYKKEVRGAAWVGLKESVSGEGS